MTDADLELSLPAKTRGIFHLKNVQPGGAGFWYYPPMAEHWNTATTVRVVVDACAAQGVETGPILHAARIDPATLEDPDGRVTLEQMRVFWQQAVEQSGDPSIGLHAGRHVTRGIYRTFEFLAGYSSTIGAAVKRFAEYMPLINSWLVMETERDQRCGRLIISTVYGFLPRTTAEYVISAFLHMTRQFWALEWKPARACFEFSRPEVLADEHAQVLGCEVEFDAPRTEMIVDAATWDLPVHTADEALVAVLEEHAQRLMAQHATASVLVQSVRDVVGRSLAGGDVGLEAVAGQLGMTGRTLQRRLSDEGLAFGDMVDMVRLGAARMRLTELHLSLGEVAYMVGFAEQSSFSRAFKRWTGMSPSDYRRSSRSAVGQ